MIRLLQFLVVSAMLVAPAWSMGDTIGGDPTIHAPSTVVFASAHAPALALAGRVTDAAHLLSARQRGRLTSKLAQIERSTRHQMVIVTVPSLGGQDIAEFTRDLANRWGVGRKGYDDGVVMLVAPNEHRVRIAVGFGLEAILTHTLCRQIIETTMTPRFRQNDFAGGIEAGTNALIARFR